MFWFKETPLIYKYKASDSLNFYVIKFNLIVVTDYNVYVV